MDKFFGLKNKFCVNLVSFWKDYERTRKSVPALNFILDRFRLRFIRRKVAKKQVARLVRWSVYDDGPFGPQKTFFAAFGGTNLRVSLSGANLTLKLIVTSVWPRLLQNLTKLTKNEFSRQKKSNFFRIVFSTFWGSPSVVGGWNFDSA